MDFKLDYKLEGEWSRTFTTLMTYCWPLRIEAELQEMVDRLKTESAVNAASSSTSTRQGNGERRHSVPHIHSE